MLDSPIRDRQSERRAATRLEILDAAWGLARESGLAELTLRDVAARVGMRAPSLYSYFASKNDIYDAMFGQAWSDYLTVVEALESAEPHPPRETLRTLARTFFDFAVAEPARHQLMNQRTIPGFVPSEAAYAPAVAALESARRQFRACGITSPEDFDLGIAVVGGLVNAQLANEPGGHRWGGLLDRAVDMIADHLGIPGPKRRTS